MTVIAIDDLSDPRLDIYRNLKATNDTRGGARFVVEGEKLVDRLIESPFPVDSVLTTDRHVARIGPKVPPGVPLYVLPHRRVDQIVGFNFHQGALACGVRRDWPAIDEIARAAGPRLTILVCPRLDNPENLGALIRLGDVFGVDAVLLGRRCPDPLSRRVLRVSMGTALRLPVLEPADLRGAVDRLRAEFGLIAAATVTDPGAEPSDTFADARPGRLALVLGSESAGLDPRWVARCDRRVTIPMRPGADSLNLAVAAGILLFQVMRSELGPRDTSL
jgi:tRNA G18 (ribose-2'-O)-methylase SpoU